MIGTKISGIDRIRRDTPGLAERIVPRVRLLIETRSKRSGILIDRSRSTRWIIVTDSDLIDCSGATRPSSRIVPRKFPSFLCSLRIGIAVRATLIQRVPRNSRRIEGKEGARRRTDTSSKLSIGYPCKFPRRDNFSRKHFAFLPYLCLTGFGSEYANYASVVERGDTWPAKCSDIDRFIRAKLRGHTRRSKPNSLPKTIDIKSIVLLERVTRVHCVSI